MRTLNHTLTILLLIVTFAGIGQTHQKIDMKIDSLGNAKINVSMTMTATQWQVWLQTIGNNPAIMKREIERSMPAYFLGDYKLEKNDMERSFNVSLMAYGVCEVDKRGNWTIDTDQKDANLTEITDHKYMLVSTPPELGGNIQQTFTIDFPEAAKNIKVDKDTFGKTIFKFDMENSTAGFNLMLWAGVLLLLIGGSWLVKNVIRK